MFGRANSDLRKRTEQDIGQDFGIERASGGILVWDGWERHLRNWVPRVTHSTASLGIPHWTGIIRADDADIRMVE